MPVQLPGLFQPPMPAQPSKISELPKLPKLSMPAQLPELPMPTQPPKHTQPLSHELFVLHQIEPQANDITLRQLLLNRARTLGNMESGCFPETWHEEHPAPCRSRIEDDVLFYCPEFEHPSANPRTQSCAIGGPIILITPPDIVEAQG
ncbi:hypothetical protein H4R24_002618 [Coemansia sp. RSA 988]|nr:hypothetical protein H4R24_002618 [Coemansia sp. RSA 988]